MSVVGETTFCSGDWAVMKYYDKGLHLFFFAEYNSLL